MGALEEPGVAVDPDRLLGLRHLAAEARRAASRRTSSRPGPFVTRRRGRGSETDDVRTWSHGDDVRHIDRNVTARTGEPHVRTFRDERERTTLLVADFRPPMLFGTRRALLSVAAAEALALVGWSAVADGGRIGVLALSPGEPVFVKPMVGERAMVAVVGALARAHRTALAAGQGVDPLGPALETAARLLPPGGTLVAASGLDAPGDGFEDALSRILHRVDLTILLVSDAFERQPPRGVYPYADRSGRRAVGLVGAETAKLSADARLSRLRAVGAGAVLVPAETEPDDLAFRLEGLDGRRA
ncbi:DUF58 domain-containing protein [Chthonobacter rhizosphaerae]|uniref:DUF58 domain-containing protein n=1 Tax=Chthonobacter rhizosphaerae TaxID=2735553 RepID=UPI0015EFBA99|nr:DUF58 domain-containing protein [Chthonobacter rhizosphaerae]